MGNSLRVDAELPPVGSAPKLTFEAVQLLRGAAASLVVFHHYCQAINSYAQRPSLIAGFARVEELGAGGVDIFFCISGLVIAWSVRRLGRGRGIAAEFLWRRFTRVLPPYWFFTTLLVLLWITGIGLKGLIVTPGLLVASYLLIPYPKATVTGELSHHPILDVGWSLTFEMYFYALCTLVLLWAGGRRIFPWLLIALAAVAAASLLLTGHSVASSVLASPLLVEFGIGALLGTFADRLRPADPRRARRIGIAAVAVGSVAFFASIFAPDPLGWRLLLWGLPGALMVYGCMLIPFAPRTALGRGGLFLGTASYTIYLAHPFLLLVAATLLKRGMLQSVQPDLLLIALTVGTVIAAAASYPFIEARIIALFARKRRRPRAAEPGQAVPEGAG